MRDKGQVFLISAVILIVILVILRIGINLPDVIQSSRKLEGNFEKDFFINVVDELTKVIDISYYQQSNITNNVYDFANFTRKKMIERMLDFDFLYVGSLANITNNETNVTSINFLNKPINITLIWNGNISSKCNSTNLLNEKVCSDTFSFNASENYVLTVSYNNTYTENVTIETKINKNIYVGFFDVTLIGKETTYKDKFQKTYTLP